MIPPNASPPPLATIVIPNYNGRRFLPELMQSLATQTEKRLTVTVVDDASRDDSVPYLREAWPQIQVRVNPKNRGFAATCNLGLRAATTPFVVLLNNDTHLAPDWLAEGLKPFDDPNVGSVASLVVLAEPPHLIDSAGDIYSVVGGAMKRNHLEPMESARALPEQVFSACGAAAFYRRDALTRIATVVRPSWLHEACRLEARTTNYVDEHLESYYDDVDIGFRLAWAGYRCVLAKNAICYHHLSSSYSPTGWRYHYNSARNAEIVWWSHMSPRLRRKYLLPHLCFIALQGLAETRRGRIASFVAGKWTVLRHVRHIRAKRAADTAAAASAGAKRTADSSAAPIAGKAIDDAYIETHLEHDWWNLHIGPRIRKVAKWLSRSRLPGGT